MKRGSLFARPARDDGDGAILGAADAPDASEGVSSGVATASASVVAAERALVGALLRSNDSFDVVAEVVAVDDFSDAGAQQAYRMACDVIEGRVQGFACADPISLASLLASTPGLGVDTLTQWRDSAPTQLEAIGTYAQVVWNAARERTLGAAVREAGAIFAAGGSLDERASSIQERLTAVAETRALPVVSIGKAAAEMLGKLAERAGQGLTGVRMSYGFPDIDALTAGLHGGQLIVIAARPGVGKTAMALAIEMACAKAGFHVLMASMEMKATELSKRAISLLSGVDSQAIRLCALTEHDWEQVITAGEQLVELPLDIVDLPAVTVQALSNVARRLKRAGRLDLVVVDYLQIMTPSGGSANKTRTQEVGDMSRGLKLLAMMLDVPVIALSQLNRASENRLDRRPQLSDLRESGAIEQDADLIAFLHQEATPDAPETSEGVIEFIIGKQRDGPTGVVSLGLKRGTSCFYSIKATPEVAETAQIASVAA